MKKYLILLLIVLAAVSCRKNKTADISDKDSGITDLDTETVDNLPDDLSDDLSDEALAESDEQPDIDADTDSDTAVPCLDLRYNENTIKTNFPFKDKNGKPTFCRPGCDTPTETDPQCVRNIWEWDNWEKYQKYLEAQKNNSAQTTIRECYPWPCKLPDMKASVNPESFNSKCDRKLTVNGFRADMGTVWSHGMSDGVAVMNFGSSQRITEYDPDRDEYSNLGTVHLYSMFNENRFITSITDRIPANFNNNKNFVISVLRKDEKYYYEFIYDSESADEEFTGSPFAGEKWALIQMSNRTTGKKSFKYASSKDWQWHNIDGIENYAGEGNIVSDHLTFITNNREIYYCDLTKHPKNISDCRKINRLNNDGTTYELGHSPRIDSENEYRLVYNVYGENKFVEVILTDTDNPEYTEYEVAKNKDTTFGWEPETLRGNKLAYADYYGSGSDAIGCFYRFDKKKSYCPQENIHPWTAQNLMGFNTFWGKWHLWKNPASVGAFMRDWECYCKESGVCPFEQ